MRQSGGEAGEVDGAELLTHVTDGVLPGVQAVGESTETALGTWNDGVVGVDNSIRGSVSHEGRGEVVWEVLNVLVVEPFTSGSVLVHVVKLVVGVVVWLGLVVRGAPDGLPVLVFGVGVTCLGWRLVILYTYTRRRGGLTLVLVLAPVLAGVKSRRGNGSKGHKSQEGSSGEHHFGSSLVVYWVRSG